MRFNVFSQRKPGSAMAMAIALACGTAVAATAVAEPAFAQKKKKKKDKEASKPYSNEFIAAYVPLDEASKQDPADWNTVVAGIPGLQAVTSRPDEKMAGGNLIYNAGIATNNNDLRLTGMKLMVESGKVDPGQLGRFNYIVYELLRGQDRHAESRTYLQAAMDNNFTYENIGRTDLMDYMARSYIAEGDVRGGIRYLLGAIDEMETASGQPADEQLYRVALTAAYENEVTPEVYEVVNAWVKAYPTESNWRDAINITRNLNTFDGNATLDLLRLAAYVGTLNQTNDYLTYIETADPRRLPQEVKDVIEQGYAKNVIDRGDPYIAETLAGATGRIRDDRAGLPALERDARAADAGLRTVVAAGDAFLSYSEFEKAEEFYAKALGMPGVETPVVATRLGISQVKQGKTDEARSSLAMVEGKYKPIAMLWSARIAETAAPVATTAPAAAPAEEAEPATGG